MNQILWQDLPQPEAPTVPLSSVLPPETIAQLQPDSVIIYTTALQAALDHAVRTAPAECIGLLRGFIATHNGQPVPVITAAEPLPEAQGTPHSVQATPATWVAAWKAQAGAEQDTAHSHILGWYHSHPRLGVFFSETDRRTQRNHFRRPWHTALVLDPSSTSKTACFLGPEAHPATLTIHPTH